MTDDNIPVPSEKESDLLRYKGNAVPRVLRLAWTLMLFFAIFYLAKYMVPDLKLWLNK